MEEEEEEEEKLSVKRKESVKNKRLRKYGTYERRKEKRDK